MTIVNRNLNYYIWGSAPKPGSFFFTPKRTEPINVAPDCFHTVYSIVIGKFIKPVYSTFCFEFLTLSLHRIPETIKRRLFNCEGSLISHESIYTYFKEIS
jgi:hypothetical protein